MARPTGLKLNGQVHLRGAPLKHLQDLARTPLTPEQKAIADEYMSRYKRPLTALKKAFPGVYRRAKILGAHDDDINQVCCLGVIRATRNFNPDLASFDTYAVSKARGEVMWWCEWQTRMKRTVTANTYPINDEICGSVPEYTPEDYVDDIAQLRNYMRILTERQKQFIRLRFGIDGVEALQFGEVGKAMGVSRQRAFQIIDAALNKIRQRILDDA